MPRHTLISYLALSAGTAYVLAQNPPAICMLSPLATIQAGQPIEASVNNPRGLPCSATLVFSDPDFLPLTFELEPVLCLGYQQAAVNIPLECPNGQVTILWDCAGSGSQSCSRFSIDGGSANVTALADMSQQTGTIECVVPVATLTTFSTATTGTVTTVRAVVETFFSTTIPIASVATPLLDSTKIANNLTTTASSSLSTPPLSTVPVSTAPVSTLATPLGVNAIVTSASSMITTTTAVLAVSVDSGSNAPASPMITATTAVLVVSVDSWSSSTSECSCTSTDNGSPFN